MPSLGKLSLELLPLFVLLLLRHQVDLHLARILTLERGNELQPGSATYIDDPQAGITLGYYSYRMAS